MQHTPYKVTTSKLPKAAQLHQVDTPHSQRAQTNTQGHTRIQLQVAGAGYSVVNRVTNNQLQPSLQFTQWSSSIDSAIVLAVNLTCHVSFRKTCHVSICMIRNQVLTPFFWRRASQSKREENRGEFKLDRQPELWPSKLDSFPSITLQLSSCVSGVAAV